MHILGTETLLSDSIKAYSPCFSNKGVHEYLWNFSSGVYISSCPVLSGPQIILLQFALRQLKSMLRLKWNLKEGSP